VLVVAAMVEAAMAVVMAGARGVVVMVVVAMVAAMEAVMVEGV